MKTMNVLGVVSLVLLASLALEVRGACKDYTITSYPLIAPAKVTNNIFHIGAFATFGTGSTLGILRFMIEQINQNMSILPNVLLQLHSAELLKSKANALLAVQALIGINASGLIGGTYADETETGQLVATVYQIPQLAALPIGAAMSNKGQYPYLARVNPPDEYQAAAMASLMKSYGWTQAFVAYSDDDYGIPGLQNLQEATKDMDITLFSTVIHIPSANFTPYVQPFKDAIAKHNVRIFLIYTQSAADGVNLMAALDQAGLVGNDTGNTFIMMYSITYTFSGNPGAYSTTKYPYMHGAVGLVTRGAIDSELFRGINASWNAANATLFPGTRPNAGSYWYFADAILTYAYAIDALMNKGMPFSAINGSNLLAQIIQSNFFGVTGQVYFDDHYDRIGDYVWYNFGPPNASSSFQNPVAIYSAATGETIFQPDQELIFYGNPRPVDGHALPIYQQLIPALSIALGVIVAIAIFVAVFASVMLGLFWDNFKTHGSFYCGVMILGVYIGYAAALVLLPIQTDGLCMLFPWLLGIGFALVYGCLFIKTWTLYKVHRSAEQMKRTTLTPLYILKGIGLYLIIELTILIVWTAVDAPTAYYNKMVDGTYVLQCTAHPTFWAIFAAVKLAWLCFGAILSVLTRHVASEYSESKSIAYATYNITALLVIAIPLALVLKDVPGGSTIIEVGIIAIALTFTMCSLFFGIWMRIFFPGKDLPSICTPTPHGRGSGSSQTGTTQQSKGSKGSSDSGRSDVVRI